MAYADADLELDFSSDWTATLRGALAALRYRPPTDDQDVHIAYFNVLKRLVPVRPRAVHVAPTLVCPPEVQAGYDEVRRKIVAGEDLRPHLSRGLAKGDFNDLLLNDWGIHHLHLGTVLEPDGFVTRTGPVLFARFSANAAYFIAVPAHGAWSSTQILESFAQAWPDQMRRYELRGITPSGHNPTDVEIAKLRAAGVQPLVAIGGRVVAPMGGGISTSKVSTEVVATMDRFVRAVRELEERVVGAKQEIFDKAHALGVVLTRPVRLRLDVRPDRSAFARTEDGRITFGLGHLA